MPMLSTKLLPSFVLFSCSFHHTAPAKAGCTFLIHVYLSDDVPRYCSYAFGIYDLHR
jgi:hypothetical protein